MRQLISFLCLLACIHLGYAKEFLPKNCHAVPIGDEVIFEKNKKQLEMIHALSTHQIWLANRENSRLTVSITPGLWSVFYAPHVKSQWHCIQSEPGHEQQVPCQQVLALCERTAKPPKKDFSKFDFWVVNNLSYSELDAYLQRMGWRLGK